LSDKIDAVRIVVVKDRNTANVDRGQAFEPAFLVFGTRTGRKKENFRYNYD